MLLNGLLADANLDLIGRCLRLTIRSVDIADRFA